MKVSLLSSTFGSAMLIAFWFLFHYAFGAGFSWAIGYALLASAVIYGFCIDANDWIERIFHTMF